MPVAAEVGTGASEGCQPPRPPFLALLEDFPDLFQKEVLERLDPLDRGMLARTGSAVRTAVTRSGLPRVGGLATGARRVSIRSFVQSLSQFVWAIANGCPWQTTSTCAVIARGGHLEVLRWAREHGCKWDTATCSDAAWGGHLEVLRWAREHDCPCEERTCAKAAEGGHLEVLRWAWEHGCPWDLETSYELASGGHLEGLKWAWEHGCPCEADTCCGAAGSGNLEIVQWLRQHHCEWDACVWDGMGCMRLDVLRWARQHDCPWDESTSEYAADHDELEVLRWLIEHGCPGGERYVHLLI